MTITRLTQQYVGRLCRTGAGTYGQCVCANGPLASIHYRIASDFDWIVARLCCSTAGPGLGFVTPAESRAACTHSMTSDAVNTPKNTDTAIRIRRNCRGGLLGTSTVGVGSSIPGSVPSSGDAKNARR